MTSTLAASNRVPAYTSPVRRHLLQVSVTDESGRPVTNLDRDDFALREDGEIRAIHTFLAPSNTPLDEIA